MPYCIYLRKSRADLEAESRGEGESLARHESALLACAQGQKLTITEIYREIASGETISSRPVMQQLLTEVEQGAWQGVLVMEVERLARGDTIDQGIVAQAFQLSGTKIITPIKTYDPNNEFDEEYFEFGLFMSRREFKTINRRLQRGRMASVHEGKYVGNRPPQGYVRVKLPDQKGWTLAPDPQRAHLIGQIFQWYTAEGADRIGIPTIARRLNEMGIASATGKDWTTATLRGILSNPVYAGWIKWGSRAAVKSVSNGVVTRSRPRARPEDVPLVKGLHEPLIGQDTFDRAQLLLHSNKTAPGPHRYGVKNPLSGLVVCRSCGRQMVRRPYGGGSPDGLICIYTSCPTVGSSLSVVEDAILSFLRQWLGTLPIATMAPAAPDQMLDTLERADMDLKRDCARLRQQIEKAYDLLEQGVYTPHIFAQRLTALEEKRIRLEEQLTTVLTRKAQLKAQNQAIGKLLPRITQVLEVYPLCQTPEDKNRLLKSVVERVVYSKSKRRHEDGGDLELEIFPRFKV